MWENASVESFESLSIGSNAQYCLQNHHIREENVTASTPNVESITNSPRPLFTTVLELASLRTSG